MKEPIKELVEEYKVIIASLEVEKKALVAEIADIKKTIETLESNFDYYQELFDDAGWLYCENKRLPLGQRIKSALEEIATK